MNKLVQKLGFVIAIAGSIAGCNLYFGPNNDDSTSTPSGSPPTGSAGSGYECAANTDCAAGCYCSNGVCAEGGFCQTDTDCGPGYTCDVQRSSCEPITCTCTSDAEAVSQGYGWCDETNGTCQTGTDPAGTCAGEVTCATAPPSCPENNVALVKDGCYTGECRAISACEAAPACSHLQHEDDCTARTAECEPAYLGHNCHHTDGSPCTDGDTTCTCDTFTYESCSASL